MLRPKSTMLTSTCTCPCGCMSPPITPVAHERLAVFHDERRNDGVERALAGGIGVGMSWIEVEELTSILKHEAEPVRHQSRAHAAIVRLDQRNHHTVLVGGGEIGR